MKAATKAAIAAITRMMGLAASTVFSAPKAVFTVLMIPASFGKTVIIEPTAVISLPTTIKTEDH